MTNSEQRVLAAVQRAIDEVNQLLPAKSRVEKEKDSLLFGGKGPLDSVGLVNLIVATEEELEKEFGATVSLLQDPSGDGIDIFHSVSTFCAYIHTARK